MTIYTKAELAKELKVSVRHIDRLIEKGLPVLRVGRSIRFVFEKVIKYLENATA